MNQELVIQEYEPKHKAELLRLLLKLQVDYFKEKVSPRHQELSKAKDDHKAYHDYISFIEGIPESWKILMAMNLEGEAAGMIIGSVTIDEDLELSVIGKLEDWYVAKKYRRQGLGAKLYKELEKWFAEKGCQQIVSDTWIENELSMEAHKHLGFFITGIQFGKKL